MSGVTVYGADWCGMTTRLLDFLDDRGFEYTYIDIDDDPKAAEFVRQHAGGKEKKPTVEVDGKVFVNPNYEELEALLRERQSAPAPK